MTPGSYEIPTEGSANSTEDPKIKTILKGYNESLGAGNKLEGSNIVSATVTDTQLASPNNAAYRELFEAQQIVKTEAAAATYFLANGILQLANSANAAAANAIPYFVFAKADYEVAGKTQKLRLRAQVAANATKPTIKFTAGLYPITVAGGANELKITLGTVVSGSTIEFNEPAASTVTSKETSDFTIPADGAYALGVVTSGTLTASAAVLASAQLQTRSV